MPRIRRSTHTQAAKHWKIGIYIRLSREDKEKEEEQIGNRHGKRRIPQNVASDSSGSIIEQDKILTEWVEDYFREEHYTIVEYFTDDGLTGTDDTRDDFQRMMEFAQDVRINCIVVKTLSRAFRNYADQGRYLEQIFPRLGVRFISSGNPFVDSYNDPDAITGGMEIPIKSGDITKEDYRNMKAEFDGKASILKAAIENIKDEIGTLADGVNSDDPYLVAFLKYKNIKELNRGIVVELIDNIYVHADGQLTIEFTFADEFKRVVDFIENSRNDLTLIGRDAVS